MSDVAGVIIASKSCSSYSVVSKSLTKRAFTCNVSQGLNAKISQDMKFDFMSGAAPHEVISMQLNMKISEYLRSLCALRNTNVEYKKTPWFQCR